MALENVAYDESRAILLITKMLKDDTNTPKKVSAAAYTLSSGGVGVPVRTATYLHRYRISFFTARVFCAVLTGRGDLSTSRGVGGGGEA
jgi:hypothetical protein